MKEQFKLYLTNQLNEKQELLLTNGLSDEDKAIIQKGIDNLTAVLAELDEAEDTEENTDALNELKSKVEELNDEITALFEKLNQNKSTETQKEETEIVMENTYLSTTNALHDFAEAIRSSKNAEEFNTNWKNAMLTNGVTFAEGSEEAYLPAAVKGYINDIWDHEADFLKDLNFTNAKRFYVRYNPTDETLETSRAKGHKKGETKVAQSIGLNSKLIDTQFIYKLQEIDKKSVWDDDGSLVAYVVKELMSRVIVEIKKCIVEGDGRANDSDYKISSFEPLAIGTADAWHAVATETEGGFLKDDMVNMVAALENPSNKKVYVLMSKATANSLRRVQASSTSTPVYMSLEQLADELGVDRIIETKWLSGTYKAVAFLPDEYLLVGDNILNPEFYTWHVGETNTNKYRAEICAGGGINAQKSVSVLLAAE